MYTLGEAKVILFCRITRLTINSRAKGCRSEGLWRGTNRPLVGLGGPLAENLSTAMRLVKSGEKPVGGLSEYRCEGSASHRLKSARRPSLARCCHARNESGWTRLSLREGPPAPGTRLRQFSADHERGSAQRKRDRRSRLETEYSRGARREYRAQWYWPISTYARRGNSQMRISRNRGPRARAIRAADVPPVP